MSKYVWWDRQVSPGPMIEVNGWLFQTNIYTGTPNFNMRRNTEMSDFKTDTPRDLLLSLGLPVPDDLPETWAAASATAKRLGLDIDFDSLEYKKMNAYGSALQQFNIENSTGIIDEVTD